MTFAFARSSIAGRRKSGWLLALVGMAPLLVEVGQPAAEWRERRPNVLLITADDLGLQLSAYGETRIETPELDRLASSGAFFDVAHVTQASCSPSRASLLTGLYPHAHGQYGLVNANAGFKLHESLTGRTLPALLSSAGYRTGVVGKVHVAPASLLPWDHQGPKDARNVRSVAAEVAGFLDEAAAGSAPFFLMVNFTDPHVFRLSAKRFGYETSVDGIPEAPIEPSEETLFSFQGVDAPEQRERVAGYLNGVLRLDAGVGLVMRALEDRNLSGSTLVIFCGDHGPPFARAKTTCYEAGLRVPLLVRWPGMAAGVRSRALVSTVDVMPTILDAAGIEPPEELHGVSLAPLLEGEAAPSSWRSHLFAEYHFHGRRPFVPRRSIRGERFKLIENLRAGEASPGTGIDDDTAFEIVWSERYDGSPARRAFEVFADPPARELYDLEADPDEWINLSGDPRYAEIEAALKEALDAWRTATADPLLDPEVVESFILLSERGRKGPRGQKYLETGKARD